MVNSFVRPVATPSPRWGLVPAAGDTSGPDVLVHEPIAYCPRCGRDVGAFW